MDKSWKDRCLYDADTDDECDCGECELHGELETKDGDEDRGKDYDNEWYFGESYNDVLCELPEETG
ncbi:uncharacterized protein LTR77_003674 [Saxophila tyrrhenica]|uniref:Uncharacterized protein n=1 Tax=Saxophila tyrrhenica TaxID=1690608 RepID=A0AAV9PII7_9PEZI|nr:hypothetical protein LTR77_003674 [Saxophila tyrrhenica]